MPIVPFPIIEERVIDAIKVLDDALPDIKVTDTVPTDANGDEPKFQVVINDNVTRLYVLASGSWRYINFDG